MTYELQLDFDQPIQEFTDLKQLFEVLRDNGHIFIYDASHEKYQQRAEDQSVDLTDRLLYIETSASIEGTFVESEAFWIENYLTGEFDNPDCRPFIEKYL